MPVSDTATAGRSLFIALKTLMMLLVVIGILSWLNQDSMRLYCQQKYHSGCELPGLGELPAWRLGADITRSLGQGREAFVAALSGHEAAPEQRRTRLSNLRCQACRLWNCRRQWLRSRSSPEPVTRQDLWRRPTVLPCLAQRPSRPGPSR